MATMFPMPKLGLDMTSGSIIHWLVKEGEAIKEGQPLVEIETDKAAQELTSPSSGILARILHTEGSDVLCGEVIAIILGPGESLPLASSTTVTSQLLPPQPPTQAAPIVVVSQDSTDTRLLVSPVARRRARELGIDLDQITPRNGRISLEDVENAHDQGRAVNEASIVPDSAPQAMSATRRRIAEHMDRSAHSVARVGLTLELDASSLIAWRENLKHDEIKVSYNVLLASLVAKALIDFPYMNSRIEGQTILILPEVHIGIAVDTPRGLVVPVLRNADRRPLRDLQAEYDALCERALVGKNLPEDLRGGTFTITNLGSLDIETFLPIINYPECAILGVGAILKKPFVVNDEVVVQPRLNLTLAFDHRLVDGAPAARFLQHVKHNLESAG
jgi:pyruvate dehydrogenase E2 component (dihydrolipoamide acetyltransferase)